MITQYKLQNNLTTKRLEKQASLTLQTCELLSLLVTNDWVQNNVTISLLFLQDVRVCVRVCRGGGGVMRGAQMLGGMGTDNNKTIREIKINIVQQV